MIKLCKQDHAPFRILLPPISDLVIVHNKKFKHQKNSHSYLSTNVSQNQQNKGKPLARVIFPHKRVLGFTEIKESDFSSFGNCPTALWTRDCQMIIVSSNLNGKEVRERNPLFEILNFKRRSCEWLIPSECSYDICVIFVIICRLRFFEPFFPSVVLLSTSLNF